MSFSVVLVTLSHRLISLIRRGKHHDWQLSPQCVKTHSHAYCTITTEQTFDWCKMAVFMNTGIWTSVLCSLFLSRLSNKYNHWIYYNEILCKHLNSLFRLWWPTNFYTSIALKGTFRTYTVLIIIELRLDTLCFQDKLHATLLNMDSCVLTKHLHLVLSLQAS